MTPRLIIILVLLCHAAFSQERNIVGRILEARTQTPIKDANIVIPGTTKATFSNHLGYFEVAVDRSMHTTFQISHIGYKIFQIPIPAEDKFRISLEKDTVQLNVLNLNQYPVKPQDLQNLPDVNVDPPTETEAMYPEEMIGFYTYMGNALAPALPLVSRSGFRITFTIDETGQATDVFISEPEEKIQTAVNQAFQKMPRWTPATQRQKNVRQLFALSVRRFTAPNAKSLELKELYTFIQRNIKYPAQAKRIGIEGPVYARFDTDKSGNVTTTRLLTELDESCNEEVKRIIGVLPAGLLTSLSEQTQQNQFVLPVFFGLDNAYKKNRNLNQQMDAFVLPPIDIVAGPLTVVRRELGNGSGSAPPRNTVYAPMEVTYLALKDAVKEQKTAKRLMLKYARFTTFPAEILNLTKLNFLDLEHNEIQVLPDWIDALTDLKELYLPHNKLTQLPDHVGNLKKLRTLGLANNQLSSFPLSITALEKLEALDLSNNQLSEIPPEIGLMKNLNVLFLTNNKIKSIPPEFFQLKKLDKIYLKGNPINPEDLALLKKTFKNAETDF